MPVDGEFSAAGLEAWLSRLMAGERRTLARTLSFAESQLPQHQQLLDALWVVAPSVRPALRIGFTGAPGAGKSTLVEQVGRRLLQLGQRVAVLTVDPSSPVSGGSLLADKTRMPELSVHPQAFVRPSAAGSHLGGVAVHTDESARICELAGFDTILIESVGVGQSEVDISELTDYAVLVLLPTSGDELQALKRGITESVDFVVVNKADGDRFNQALELCGKYSSSLALLRPRADVRVSAVSALSGDGIDALVSELLNRAKQQAASGELSNDRQLRAVRQFRRCLSRVVVEQFWRAPGREQRAREIEAELALEGLSLRQALDRFWAEQ
jgi:LAO/AO transport system kinase